MPNPKDYTILWICALSNEYVAAQSFLDEEHPKPDASEISQGDTNSYTLGRIAKHNVVMTVLPMGEYGVGSTASVITNVLNTFPNIKVGLMVGIGGGAPTSKNDIRLGDVIVSSPEDGNGGVYHYDFGKEMQGSGFKQTGFLNQPPTIVRTALAELRAKHERKGHNIVENIEAVLEENRKLRKRYACPGPESDHLFKSDFVHPAGIEGCENFCGNQKVNTIIRQLREEDDDNPAIHYGLIASGNKVMKDALIRDKLAREKHVLCFEMEAAGLMNRFPCLVVRGICDYSDSHKNKSWQGYAAMTAAAYVKELLQVITLHSVEKEKTLAESIERSE